MFQNLVLSGGGYNGIIYIGCIKYMIERKMMKFKNVIGSSIGSIFGLCICLNVPIDKLIHYTKQATNQLTQDIQVDIQALLNIWYSFGAFDTDNIKSLIEEILTDNNLPKTASFIDLAKHTGINYIVTASNLTKQKVEYFGMDENNTIDIVTAIQCSCAVPLFFKPIIVHGDMYVDAGLLCNTPSEYWTKKMAIQKDTLVLKFKNTDEALEGKTNHPDSLLSYINMLMSNVFTEINDKTSLATIVQIPYANNVLQQLLLNEMSEIDIDHLIKIGYQTLTDFFT
jgi:predicted acylesterase/phospholipase RssA